MEFVPNTRCLSPEEFGSNDQCKLERIGESKHCVKHAPASVKLYTNYKKSQHLADIHIANAIKSGKAEDYLKAHSARLDEVRLRREHMTTYFIPEARDLGHYKRLVDNDKMIREYETKLEQLFKSSPVIKNENNKESTDENKNSLMFSSFVQMIPDLTYEDRENHKRLMEYERIKRDMKLEADLWKNICTERIQIDIRKRKIIDICVDRFEFLCNSIETPKFLVSDELKMIRESVGANSLPDTHIALYRLLIPINRKIFIGGQSLTLSKDTKGEFIKSVFFLKYKTAIGLLLFWYHTISQIKFRCGTALCQIYDLLPLDNLRDHISLERLEQFNTWMSDSSNYIPHLNQILVAIQQCQFDFTLLAILHHNGNFYFVNMNEDEINNFQKETKIINRQYHEAVINAKNNISHYVIEYASQRMEDIVKEYSYQTNIEYYTDFSKRLSFFIIAVLNSIYLLFIWARLISLDNSLFRSTTLSNIVPMRKIIHM